MLWCFFCFANTNIVKCHLPSVKKIEWHYISINQHSNIFTAFHPVLPELSPQHISHLPHSLASTHHLAGSWYVSVMQSAVRDSRSWSFSARECNMSAGHSPKCIRFKERKPSNTDVNWCHVRFWSPCGWSSPRRSWRVKVDLIHWSLEKSLNSLRPSDIKLTIIDSDNGLSPLSPGWRQVILWTNARILLIGPLGTNFIECLIGIQTFSLK